MTEAEQAGQGEIAAFLGNPDTWGVAEVDRIETHGAIVFLVGDDVWKMKRQVRYPYMDFSTLERRRLACEAELALNRRTAPGLYYEVVAVTRDEGRLRIGGPGTPLEWLVRMARFPQECLLDRMAERNKLTPAMIARLADRVAAFHADAEPAPPGGEHGGSAAFAQTLAGNLDGLNEAPPDWFDAASLAALRAAAQVRLAETAPLLDRRKSRGRVRRCHGDLHLRNICILDGEPTLFDAIEFSDALGWIDVFDDLAFLLMDLEHRGLRKGASALLTRYVLESGDVGGLTTLPLFLANRAMVRAKVAVDTAALPGAGDRADGLRRDARAYLDAVRHYLAPSAPVLVAVGGPSGGGKTTLAARLASGLGPAPGAIHLRSDVVRKRLLGVAEQERLPPEAYDAEMHDRVFAELFRLAEAVLSAGHAAILDGVFGLPEQRQAVEAVARRCGVAFVGLWLDGDVETLAARVAAREGDASDATPEIVRQQIARGFGDVGWRVIAAGGDAGRSLAAARAALTASGISAT